MTTLPPKFHPSSPNAHAGGDYYDKHLFGNHLYLVIAELPTAYLEAMIARDKLDHPKTAPSVATLKAVLKECAAHTTTRADRRIGYRVEPYVAETIEQLSGYLGYDDAESRASGRIGGRDAIKNALATLERAGLVVTLKRGAKGMATMRQVRLPDPAELAPYLTGRVMPRYVLSVELDLGGIEIDHSGKETEHSGKQVDHSGTRPATPSSYQDLSKLHQAPRVNVEKVGNQTQTMPRKYDAVTAEQLRKQGYPKSLIEKMLGKPPTDDDQL